MLVFLFSIRLVDTGIITLRHPDIATDFPVMAPYESFVSTKKSRGSQ
jgi:hypothetical protein